MLTEDTLPALSTSQEYIRGQCCSGFTLRIEGWRAVFSPEFTGQRAQISHDHSHHLECSDCQYQTFVACVPSSTKHSSSVQCSLSSVFRAQVQVGQVGVKKKYVGFEVEPKGTLLILGQTQRAH